MLQKIIGPLLILSLAGFAATAVHAQTDDPDDVTPTADEELEEMQEQAMAQAMGQEDDEEEEGDDENNGQEASFATTSSEAGTSSTSTAATSSETRDATSTEATTTATTSRQEAGTTTTATGTIDIVVMKHVCPARIALPGDFNQLGTFLNKVQTCPTVVNPNDTPSADSVSGGTQPFSFSVEYANPDGQTVTRSAPDRFFRDRLCETDVNADLNGNNSTRDNTCLDASSYAFDNVPRGNVTVREATPFGNLHYGALEFTPSEIEANNDASALISAQSGTIRLNTASSTGDNVTLHVFDFYRATSTETGAGTSTAGNNNGGADDGNGSATGTPAEGAGFFRQIEQDINLLIQILNQLTDLLLAR